MAGIFTRLDLAYSGKVLSLFCKNFGPTNVELVKHIPQYISGTLDLGLTFDKKTDMPDNVIGYTDSNFAGLKTDRKLIRDYVFILADVAINHISKLWLIVVLSTYEAEYVIMREVGKEAV